MIRSENSAFWVKFVLKKNEAKSGSFQAIRQAPAGPWQKWFWPIDPERKWLTATYGYNDTLNDWSLPDDFYFS